MTEAIFPSETSVLAIATRRHIAEDGILQTVSDSAVISGLAAIPTDLSCTPAYVYRNFGVMIHNHTQSDIYQTK
jgi:hypothetical protein